MRANLDRRPADVAAMFDAVAERYDLLNDVLSLGQDRLWRRFVAATVAAGPGERVLDLAAGTGTSARAGRSVGAGAADRPRGPCASWPATRCGRRSVTAHSTPSPSPSACATSPTPLPPSPRCSGSPGRAGGW